MAHTRRRPPASMAPIPPTPREDDSPTAESTVNTAVHVLSTERAALAHLETLYQTEPAARNSLGRAADQIVHSVQNNGKLVFCGVGKSGKIAQKLEATMNSLGIYSTFLHPTEALHGDLGIVRSVDTLIMISFSGRSQELLALLPHIPSSVPLIAITAHLHPSTCPLFASSLALGKDILLPAPVHEKEEVSFGVSAPTSSTLVALALGDALAIAAAKRLHSSSNKSPAAVFRGNHPGGNIGASDATTTIRTDLTTPSTSTSTSTLARSIPSRSPASASTSSTNLPTLLDLFSPVRLSDIPIMHTSSRPRLLDILLTAIQHPMAKSWVFLSPDRLIPPSRVRCLARDPELDRVAGDVEIESEERLAVPRDEWIVIPSGWTLCEAREALDQVVSEGGAGEVVVVVVEDGVGREREREVLGVLEMEDIVDT